MTLSHVVDWRAEDKKKPHHNGGGFFSRSRFLTHTLTVVRGAPAMISSLA
jgi:hypothetical protein